MTFMIQFILVGLTDQSVLQLPLFFLFLVMYMAPHSSTLAWKIPWTEEPVRLQSMGLLRVGHDWPTSLSLFTFMHWRRKWEPTPVFLPGESQGWGSLVGCRLWGLTESDTLKWLSIAYMVTVMGNLSLIILNWAEFTSARPYALFPL